ncbi:MAG: hypothetical protein ACNI27_15195 [Desulfovibrio sp.]
MENQYAPNMYCTANNYVDLHLSLRLDNEFLHNEFEKIREETGGKERVSHKKIRKHYSMVLANLYVAVKRSSITWVAYSRNKNDYSGKDRYNVGKFSCYYLVRVTDALKDCGMIEHMKGYYDRDVNPPRARLSRMRATKKLRDIFETWDDSQLSHSTNTECIILRGRDKKRVNYKQDTQQIQTMRKKLTQINELLDKSEISLDCLTKKTSERGEQPDKKEGELIAFWETYLVRVFNNSSFRQGGRFYCGWWQGIGKEVRSQILIDGQPTVEKDYCSLHPSMLYVRETGKLPEHDPYEIEGYEGNKLVRKISKFLLLIMINAGVGVSIKRAFNSHVKPNGKFSLAEREEIKTMDIPEIIKKLKKRNKEIKKYFSSNEGIKLQYQDSQIAERVMWTLAKEQIVCLPVHDSFIVQQQHEDRLVEVMREAFHWKCGAYPRID